MYQLAAPETLSQACESTLGIASTTVLLNTTRDLPACNHSFNPSVDKNLHTAQYDYSYIALFLS